MIESTVQEASPHFFPAELEVRADLGEMDSFAVQMVVKTAASTAHFTTQWMMQQLHLPHRIIDEILWELKDDKLVEMMGQVGPLTYQYRVTNAGVEFAKRLMDLCGYMGPTPVSLEEYINSVEHQRTLRQDVSLEDVQRATSDLTFPDEIIEVAALAFASNRSLFMFGPPGNGKSSLGRLLHRAIATSIWIPYAISVDGQVIRLYDPQFHTLLDTEDDLRQDTRWIKIKQPFVTSGGELTIDQLDLVYDRSVNYYEAPPHMKANCGTYFIDDLGRQRVPPFDLLNRWIVPLEQFIDYLSLVNGKKIEVPFQMMLIVATNLKTADVSDAAFLRRMGYRIHLGSPSEAHYRIIFERQAHDQGLQLDDDVLDSLIKHYQSENRPWRSSEPRDLLIRCADVISLYQQQPVVTRKTIETAWRGYFSNESDE